MSYQDILTFWFEEITEKQWFVKDEAFDELLRERFGAVHTKVAAGDIEEWGNGPQQVLASIIVLDQFSRNMFRDAKEAFAHDAEALALAQYAVEKGYDQELSPKERVFVYMPYMHSESKAVHEEALRLFTELGNENNLKYEKLHKAIIDRFGRYPHRNEILGRETTEEEQDFMNSDEHSSF